MFIHDYGVVGLTLLLAFFWALFKHAWRADDMKDKVPLVLLFIALLTKSLFSGFVIYEYSIYAFALLGLIVGKQRSGSAGSRRLEPA
jgi:hypothetical protein